MNECIIVYSIVFCWSWKRKLTFMKRLRVYVADLVTFVSRWIWKDLQMLQYHWRIFMKGTLLSFIMHCYSGASDTYRLVSCTAVLIGDKLES